MLSAKLWIPLHKPWNEAGTLAEEWLPLGTARVLAVLQETTILRLSPEGGLWVTLVSRH